MTLYLIKYTWMQVPFTIDSDAHWAVNGTYYNWFKEFIIKYACEIEYVKKLVKVTYEELTNEDNELIIKSKVLDCSCWCHHDPLEPNLMCGKCSNEECFENE